MSPRAARRVIAAEMAELREAIGLIWGTESSAERIVRQAVGRPDLVFGSEADIRRIREWAAVHRWRDE